MLARLHFAVLFLAHAVWFAAIAHMDVGLLSGDRTPSDILLLVVTILATVVVQIRVGSVMPDLAAAVRVAPARAMTSLSFAGAVGLCAGIASGLGLGPWRPDLNSLWDRGSLAGALLSWPLLFTALLWRKPGGPSAPFFLRNRAHVADADARRCLVAGVVHAFAAALAVAVVIERPAARNDAASLADCLLLFSLSYATGILLSWFQGYAQRQVGLLPMASWAAVLAALAAWIAPAAEWPVMLLGIACGLAHCAPRNWLTVLVPPGQRALGLLLMALAQTIGVLLAVGIGKAAAGLSPAAMRGIVLILFLAIATVATRAFLRELTEQATEMLIWISYLVRGYGPGMRSVPTRGPVLVIANHCAWLDPLWVAKVLPLHLRPMMTSRFYDLPLIRWLMTHVFHAIRVPESAFRREAPEVHDAIAALQRGENVLIFPEGWLKRKEEQSLRRFGQGIYQILREVPRTPVVACWIEGSWGSFVSFFKGPPTKNKKVDFLRNIRIGVSAPEVLSLDVLHDHHQTRRHLMLAVLNARSYVGLPPLPPPPFAAGDEEKDDGPGEEPEKG